MFTVPGVGNGYYNNYHIVQRVGTKTAKVVGAWYNQEIASAQKATSGRVAGYVSELAENFRTLASAYEDLAVKNRKKYDTSIDTYAGLYEKYYGKDSVYAAYSEVEKKAMLSNEFSMTLYGVIGDVGIADYATILKDPRLKGAVPEPSGKESKEVNAKTLGAQIGNIFRRYGVDLGVYDDTSFLFSISGMTDQLSVSVLNSDPTWRMNNHLLQQMTNSLNQQDYAKSLFYDLLYDSSRNGTNRADQIAKWSFWKSYNQMTGQDIRLYQQRPEGFFDSSGQNARDLFLQALQTSERIPASYKDMVYENFLRQEDNVMQYSLASIPDLTMSMIYRNGNVRFGSPYMKNFNQVV